MYKANKISGLNILIFTSIIASLTYIYYTRYLYFYCKYDILNHNLNIKKFKPNKNVKVAFKNEDKIDFNKISEEHLYFNAIVLDKDDLGRRTTNNEQQNENKSRINNIFSIYKQSENSIYLTKYICSNIYRDFKSNALTYYTLYKIYYLLEYIENKELFLENMLNFSNNLKRISIKMHYIESVILKTCFLVIQIVYLYCILQSLLIYLSSILEQFLEKISLYVFVGSCFFYFLIVAFRYSLLENFLVQIVFSKLCNCFSLFFYLLS